MNRQFQTKLQLTHVSSVIASSHFSSWQGPSVDNLVITVDGLSAFDFFIRQGPGINNLIITINGFSTFGLLVRE